VLGIVQILGLELLAQFEAWPFHVLLGGLKLIEKNDNFI
jgi:hypothetical protein